MAILGNGILSPVVSLIFGILVLVFPRILNYLIGGYLIVIGILGIIGTL
ncbi:hypothetical protein CMO83_03365 [Candidatus Woesearchaeota archaeon]|jgi:hypothetical protein|nr:hypothetical protein [Candidatus Woesearchaeota archaeon]MDP6648082.1 DUF3096 domain-containing protein [Candidatus Woesearchaeota archaeon]|tara:strand:+ start:23794 stop:23940 length:147 start_codon:yes stop_codon:yes gene_type:complete